MPHPQTQKDAAIYQGSGTDAVERRTVSGRVAFDGLGRTVLQYYPTTHSGAITSFYQAVDEVAPTKTFYDALDRTVKVILPDGSETVTAYRFGDDRRGEQQAETTVIDAEGHEKATYKDMRGLITSVKEHLIDEINQKNEWLWTSYRYDAMKQITQVKDAENNLTTVAYDNLGRRLSIDNPDMGKMEMAYDLAGNMISKITANLRQQGQDKVINYAYEFGRLTAITYPDAQGSANVAGAGIAGSAGATNNPADVQGCTIASDPSAEICEGANNNVSYEYGAPGASDNRAGRITKVTHQAGYEERFYDAHGCASVAGGRTPKATGKLFYYHVNNIAHSLIESLRDSL